MGGWSRVGGWRWVEWRSARVVSVVERCGGVEGGGLRWVGWSRVGRWRWVDWWGDDDK